MDQASQLYRRQAYEYHLREHAPDELLQVSPPWTWWLLSIVGVGVLVALALAFLGSVEVNTRATAILRPGEGVRSLVPQVSGTVRSVEKQPGEPVAQGDVVLTLEAPLLEAEALALRREVELLEAEFTPLGERQVARQEEQLEQARERVARTAEQVASLGRSAQVYRERWRSLEPLAESQVVSRFSLLDAQEQYAQVMRQLSEAEQALSLARQEVSALEGRNDSERWERRRQLADASARLSAVELSLSTLVVRAPSAGTVDAVVLRRGDAVTAGTVLGKVIPDGHRFRVTSFLPEKDRAFVDVGDAVRLELAQLPYGEYGTLGARVIRISDDLVSPHQVQDALGSSGQLASHAYQVELELEDTDAVRRAEVPLRSGMLMQARFTLRRQRPAAIILEPLKRWLD